MKVLSLIFLIASLNTCFSANILAVTTLASPSHHIWHEAYLSALVKNGHNITVLTHEKAKEKLNNLTVFTLEGVYEKLYKDFTLEGMIDDTPLRSILALAEWDVATCKYDLETNALRTLLNYPKDYKFDLIIWDVNGGFCLYSLIDRFGTPPVIATSPFGFRRSIGYVFGNPIFSYVPFYHVKSADEMTFSEKLENFFYVHLMNLSRLYYLTPRQNAIARNYFGDKIRGMTEFERHISLLLVNSDPVLNLPQPMPPNIIPVGGLHIKPLKELPQDIKTILDEAKHGVILFIFGTNVNIDDIGAEQREAFINTFKRLPQTILMKAPKRDLNLPSNVITRRWLPQSDILAHLNLRLFITHGGALSTQEAIYHGVPIVGVPFFLDQHGNMAKLTARGVGKSIDYFNVTADLIYDVIFEVIENPIYRRNMQAESRKFRDQPETPMQRALFWTEYLLRHGTAEHLSPATRDMTIFQRLDLDISAALFIICMLFVIISLVVINCLYRVCRRRDTNIRSKLKHS